MKRLLMLATLCMALSMLLAPIAMAQTGDKDCKDFPSQAAAQSYFTSHGGSASNNFNDLDANHNGQACEDFNYGAPQSSTMMQGSTMMAPTTMMQSSGMQSTMMQPSTMMESSGMQGSTTMESSMAAPAQPTTSMGTPAQGALPGTITTLPNSGGPAILLPAAGLLLGVGLVGFGVMRRR